MGRKIPMDIAQRMAKSNKNDSIFNRENPYGYKININHPKIRPFYDVFKQKYKLKILSDKERFAFEAAIFQMLERKKYE